MDAKRLDEIEARANKATAGPWYALDGAAEGFDGSWDVAGPDGCGIAGMTATAPAATILRDRRANAEFVAAARTDVPDLVDEVRRLAAELAAAREREAGLRERLRQELVDNLSEETAKWEQLGNHPGARERRWVALAQKALQEFDAESAALSAAPAGEGVEGG